MLLDTLSNIIMFSGVGIGVIISLFIFSVNQDRRKLLIGGIINTIFGAPLLAGYVYFIYEMFSGSSTWIIGFPCVSVILALTWAFIGRLESVQYFYFATGAGIYKVGSSFIGSRRSHIPTGTNIGCAIPFITTAIAYGIVSVLRLLLGQ